MIESYTTALYCPRCDRQYMSGDGPAKTLLLLTEHIRKAHPDYIATWDDMLEDAVNVHIQGLRGGETWL